MKNIQQIILSEKNLKPDKGGSSFINNLRIDYDEDGIKKTHLTNIDDKDIQNLFLKVKNILKNI